MIKNKVNQRRHKVMMEWIVSSSLLILVVLLLRGANRTFAAIRIDAMTAAPAAQIHPRSSRGLIFSA